MPEPAVRNLKKNIGARMRNKNHTVRNGFKPFLTLCVLITCLNQAWASEPFAVVELFASEGCSSCPPADDFLHDLTRAAQEKGTRVYTLSFEVVTGII